MMQPVQTFNVVPSLPAPLERLGELARNLRWTWDHDTIDLFQRLDPELWETTGHKPVLLLGSIDQERVEAAASDDGVLAHLDRVWRDFAAYVAAESTWCSRAHGKRSTPLVAYFSAEFGLTECLSIFARGLGILAGDYLKSASDLGVPVVGVGLLYQEGYFRQRLNSSGWQQEEFADNDFPNLPLTLERHSDGTALTISVDYPGRAVLAQVWRAQVGRVPLYLLGTNVSGNRPEDREITNELYGGDLEMRIKQEILLGIGGVRALATLGHEPAVYHMNEGHAAFLTLERIRELMSSVHLSFAEAREAASAGLVFTTHTPVAAGHDYFPPDLIERYFDAYARDLGLSLHEFLALGRQDPTNDGELFCMTVLALRLAAYGNGVSRLHGQVTRRMWQGIWPRVPENEIPIGYVTNGVHLRSWISHELDELFDRYLGFAWRDEPADARAWREVERISAEELWSTHERARERLVGFARQRVRSRAERRGAPAAEIADADDVLDPAALTIGFGRRFATYKRATLLLRDPDRLARLLGDSRHPVQLIFTGKAHPRDDAGKELIRQIVTLSRQDPFRHRIVFLEDDDVAVTRALVQGSDVWLNTPRRPLEASGTSGMKAAINGVLNLSVRDGWWDEAWGMGVESGVSAGWSIGRGETYDNPDEQDRIEAEALYDMLERDVIPTFYDRGTNHLPRRWIAMMKGTIGTLCHFFNTHRVVREYLERFYLPAATRSQELGGDEMARARLLAAWKARVAENWPAVRIDGAESSALGELTVGHAVPVRARVQLGRLTPDDVSVELYLGRVNPDGHIVDAEATPLRVVEVDGDGGYLYAGSGTPCHRSGLHGYTIRARPTHPDLGAPFLPGLIAWAPGTA
jgi:starch phosphorylase